jgi:queuine tRNA-ribosyltransferase
VTAARAHPHPAPAEAEPAAASGLALAHGAVRLPAFLPEATTGVVRAVGVDDLARCGVEGLMMNTFHLMQRPGSSTIAAFGDLHGFTGWQGPIVTDSGGFQAYSLLRDNPSFGRVTDHGLTWRAPHAERSFQLTPEKSVQLQLRYGADIVYCLDQCTHVDEDEAVQEAAVRRTLAWAARGKAEFERLVAARRRSGQRPLLFAIIQGGASPALRRRCAAELLAMGFDGYGYGGWPFDAGGRLLRDMLALVREAVPAPYPLHALGVGHPAHILECVRLGYTMFDSALPTRDARHGRLYTWKGRAAGREVAYVYAFDARWRRANRPIDEECDCATCRTYTLGYLHHLKDADEALFARLATVHNLRFVMALLERERGAA